MPQLEQFEADDTISERSNNVVSPQNEEGKKEETEQEAAEQEAAEKGHNELYRQSLLVKRQNPEERCEEDLNSLVSFLTSSKRKNN